jgi:anti-sigma B factor antagonist
MPRFEIHITTDDSVTTARVTGEFDMAAAEEFREQIESAIAIPPELVVVDLRATTFMDSSGLSELIQLYKREDLTIAILRPPPKVFQIFELTGLDQHLPLYDPDVPLTHLPRRG